MSMKLKIIIPMVCVLVVLITATTFFSSVRFTAYSEMLFNDRIFVATNGFKLYMSDRERDTRIAAVSAASDPAVISAVADKDGSKITRLFADSLEMYHVDFVIVTDETGVVLTRSAHSGMHGDSIANQTSIKNALNGNVFTSVGECVYSRVAIHTGAPIYGENGELIGVVSAGVSFDSNENLDMLKEHYNAEFGVYCDGIRIATTLKRNGVRVINFPLNAEAAEYIYKYKEEYYGEGEVFGENYSVFYMPLFNEQGEVFAVMGAGHSNAEMIKERNILQLNIIFFGLLALLASIATLLFIISRLLKPAEKISRLIKEVSAGNMDDFEQYEDAAANDEIGMLTRDIYSLVGVIKSILKDLSRLTRDLDKFGDMEIEIDESRYAGAYKDIIDGIIRLSESVSTMKKTMAIMDHLDAMISVVDLDYNLLYVNRSIVDFYGMDNDNYIGKKCYKAIRNLNSPCAICQLPKLLPDRDSYPYIDYDNVSDDATGMYIGGRAAIIRWVDGKQVFFNSVKDETIRIEYQKELRQATTAAEDATLAKSIFLANMSHEIRTPMNSIIGFAELAFENEITPATREYLAMIKENANWLMLIINDILDLTKVESGSFRLESTPFDLRDLLNKCKRVVLPKAIEKNIYLRFYVEPSIVGRLLGDPLRLRQVLLNILSNALKFTAAGSVELLVTLKNKTESSVMMRFEVKDTGIGMTPEQCKKILEPFIQADESTTRKYGGTGLGMPITKNIIEMMGGSLEIESELGKGTTIGFEIELETTDAAYEEFEAVATEKEIEKPSFTGEILICEDNQMNQRVILDHLNRIGLTAELAVNGREGVEKARERMKKNAPFDLILMDIHMPEMDGIEASEKIIELGVTTPIIAMTANIMADDRELYKTAGMADYLGKPFTSQELWGCLLKYLKPVKFTGAAARENENADTALLSQLKTDFVKNNRNMFGEIKKAAENGEIELAHRLAHSMKNNAALIGKNMLKDAAAAVEAALKNGENRVTQTQMGNFQTALTEALIDLDSYSKEADGEKNEGADIKAGFVLSKDETIELFDELEPLLRSGNPECLKMISDLRAIPGSGELIKQMEDFYFRRAADTLSGLRKRMG